MAAAISFTVVLPLLPTMAIDRQGETSPPERRERAERRERVGDREQAPRDLPFERAAQLVGDDDRGSRATLECLRDEVVTVEALAFQRDEQIAASRASANRSSRR